MTGCIDGYQISDLNAGLPGWTTRARLAGGSGLIYTGVSDSTGYYRIDRLPLGVYLVWAEMQSGWEPVTPAEQTVTVSSIGACQQAGFTNRRRTPPPTEIVAPPCLPSPASPCCSPSARRYDCLPSSVSPCCLPGIVVPLTVTATSAITSTPAVTATPTPSGGGPTPGAPFDWLDWLWRNWLRIVPIMSALALTLLGLLYWYLRRSRPPTPPGGGNGAGDVNTALRVQRESIASLSAALEQVRARLTSYSSWIERWSEHGREMRVKQTELRSALASCRQDQLRLVQLRKTLEQLNAGQGGQRISLDETHYQQYRQELHRLFAALRTWQGKLGDGQKELERLQLAVHPHLAGRIALQDDLARLEQIRTRLLLLQGRLDSGEITRLDAAYYQIVQSVLECRLQIEQIDQRRVGALSAEETIRLQADFDQLASLVNAYSLELRHIRRRARHLRILLAQVSRRRSSFTLDDVGKEPTDLESPRDEPPAPDGPARPSGGDATKSVVMDDREPLIEWEILQDQQTEHARLMLAIRVRNPHVDLVFGNLAVELSVRHKADGAADEEIIALTPTSRLEFGDVHFGQAWETRELSLQGSALQQERLLVYIIATWTVWPVGFSAAKRTISTSFASSESAAGQDYQG
jgi:hypothetical protein